VITGQGPLPGILTALEHAPTNDVVVLPVDMPNAIAAPLAWLTAQLRLHPDAAAIMLRHREDRRCRGMTPAPLAARYGAGTRIGSNSVQASAF